MPEPIPRACHGDEHSVKLPSVCWVDETAPKRKGWLSHFACLPRLPKLRLRLHKKRKRNLAICNGEVSGCAPLPLEVADTYSPTIQEPIRTPDASLRRDRMGSRGGLRGTTPMTMDLLSLGYDTPYRYRILALPRSLFNLRFTSSELRLDP